MSVPVTGVSNSGLSSETTEAPAGTGGAPETGDDALNTIGSSIASASTVNLGASSGRIVTITGGASITSFGSTADVGSRWTVRFTGAPMLTHSSSLYLLGQANMQMNVGDIVSLYVASVGNWVMEDVAYSLDTAVPATTKNGAGWSVGDYGKGITAADPYLIGLDPARGTVFGGRMNRAIAGSGELSIGVWDFANDEDRPQYSLFVGWSLVTLSLGNGGNNAKGTSQTGYNTFNSAMFCNTSGIANASVAPGTLVQGGMNIGGSTTRSTQAVPIHYHDNVYNNGSANVARIKVRGDRTAEFPVNEWVMLRFFPALADGVLTTRTSDTEGVLTLLSGWATAEFDVDQTITVRWNGGANSRTLVVSAVTPSGGINYVVTASGGSGDVLPSAATNLFITKPTGGTPRVAKNYVAAVSHSAGETTITFNKQFACTFDVSRFDTLTSVTATAATDLITKANHGLRTGDPTLFTGTATGLTTGTVYFPIFQTTGTLKFASTYANAIAGTTIDITGDGTGITLTAPNYYTPTVMNVHLIGDATWGYGDVTGEDCRGYGSGYKLAGYRNVIAHTSTGSSVNGTLCFNSGDYSNLNGTSLHNYGNNNDLSGSGISVWASNCNCSGTNYIVPLGANNNAISGYDHTIAATVLYSRISGGTQTVSAPSCSVSGDLNAVAIAAAYSVTDGRRNTNNKPYTRMSGYRGIANHTGGVVHSAGTLNNNGDMQDETVWYGVRTTNATPIAAYVDYADTPAEIFTLVTGGAALIEFVMLGTGDGTGAAGSAFQTQTFTKRGTLKRTSSGGSYSWHPEDGLAAMTKIANPAIITAISGNLTIVTVTTNGEHGCNTGDTVVLAGTGIGFFDGTFTATRIDRNNFSVPNVNAGSGSIGTATVTLPWTVTLAANAGLECLVTGAASKNINWHGRCRTICSTRNP